MKKAFLLFVTLTAGVVITACGGGGGTPAPTGPTITSLTNVDGSVALLPSVAGDISDENQYFIVTFSTNMDGTTLTSSNITISCSVTGLKTATATVTTPATVYMIQPSAPAPQQGEQCTLIFGTGILDASGNPLSAAVTFIADIVSQADFEKAAKAAKIAAGGAEMIAKFSKVCSADGAFMFAFTDAGTKIAQCGVSTLTGPCDGSEDYDKEDPLKGSYTVAGCTYTGTCVATVVFPADISISSGGACITTVTDYELEPFTVGAGTYTPTLNVTSGNLTAAMGSGTAHVLDDAPTVSAATFSNPITTTTGTLITVLIDDGSTTYQGTVASSGTVVISYDYVAGVSSTTTAVYTASTTTTSTVIYEGDTFACTGVGGTLSGEDIAHTETFTPASMSCVKQ